MSELDEMLAEVREGETHRHRRGSVTALTIAGVAVVGALVAAGTLMVSAGVSIAEAGLGGPSPVAVAGSADRVVPNSSDAAELAPAPAAAAGEAPVGDGPPVYDASTDIATIPRPPADWLGNPLGTHEIWLEQQGIIADCMLELGFEYHFTPSWIYPPEELARLYREGPAYDFDSPEGIALWGHPDRGLGDDYDWREAGCHGYAVHVTGMDDAH